MGEPQSELLIDFGEVEKDIEKNILEESKNTNGGNILTNGLNHVAEAADSIGSLDLKSSNEMVAFISQVNDESGKSETMISGKEMEPIKTTNVTVADDVTTSINGSNNISLESSKEANENLNNAFLLEKSSLSELQQDNSEAEVPKPIESNSSSIPSMQAPSSPSQVHKPASPVASSIPVPISPKNHSPTSDSPKTPKSPSSQARSLDQAKPGPTSIETSINNKVTTAAHKTTTHKTITTPTVTTIADSKTATVKKMPASKQPAKQQATTPTSNRQQTSHNKPRPVSASKQSGNARVAEAKPSATKRPISAKIDVKTNNPTKNEGQMQLRLKSPNSECAGSSVSTPRSTTSMTKEKARSKVGSLDNAKHVPGGGNVKIASHKVNVSSVTSRCGSKDNMKHVPKKSEVKIESKKLEWKVDSKIGSMEKSKHKPGGGDKKIESMKLEWTAKSKVGSLDNAKHQPGGGEKKVETMKLDFKEKAHSRIGSKDNIKHKPGGGTKKIETQRLNFSEAAQPRIDAHLKINNAERLEEEKEEEVAENKD